MNESGNGQQFEYEGSVLESSALSLKSLLDRLSAKSNRVDLGKEIILLHKLLAQFKFHLRKTQLNKSDLAHIESISSLSTDLVKSCLCSQRVEDLRSYEERRLRRATKVTKGASHGKGRRSRKSKSDQGKNRFSTKALIILKSWFEAHRSHPYPTETDKKLLCEERGIGHDQLKQWLINARRRPFKPVEVCAEYQDLAVSVPKCDNTL